MLTSQIRVPLGYDEMQSPLDSNQLAGFAGLLNLDWPF